MKALIDALTSGALTIGRLQLRAWWVLRRPFVMRRFKRSLRVLDERLPW